MAPRYTQVATSRVPLNMFFACATKPVRKPVLPRDKMLPMVYRMANLVGRVHMSEERKLQKRPAETQMANPYSLCMRES